MIPHRQEHGATGRSQHPETGLESHLHLLAAGSCTSSHHRHRLIPLPASLTRPHQISFTFILPLFPKLLEFYRNSEAPIDAGAPPSKTLLSSVFGYLNAYKAAFARPIDSRYDIVLLGGALGSLFS